MEYVPHSELRLVKNAELGKKKIGGKMKAILKFFIILFVAIFISSCAIKEEIGIGIHVRHKLTQEQSPIKYAFLPLENQKSSSEYKEFLNLIMNEFTRYNFEATNQEDAEVLVSFRYDVHRDRCHHFDLLIIEKKSFYSKKINVIYHVHAGGACATQIDNAFPNIIKAIFKDFPGETGSYRSEKIGIGLRHF